MSGLAETLQWSVGSKTGGWRNQTLEVRFALRHPVHA